MRELAIDPVAHVHLHSRLRRVHRQQTTRLAVIQRTRLLQLLAAVQTEAVVQSRLAAAVNHDRLLARTPLAEVEGRVLDGATLSRGNLYITSGRFSDHVHDGEIGIRVHREELRIQVALERSAHVPVGVIRHVDYRALGGVAVVLKRQLVLRVQRECDAHLRVIGTRLPYGDFARIVLVAIGRDDRHLHADGFRSLDLLELPHLLEMTEGRKADMAPAHLSSVETVRTIVHAHLVVDAIKRELAVSNSVGVSIHEFSTSCPPSDCSTVKDARVGEEILDCGVVQHNFLHSEQRSASYASERPSLSFISTDWMAAP